MTTTTMTTTTMTADYTATITIDAPPEAVFDAVTTVSGLARWWNSVSGSGAEGGELSFDMGRPEGPLVIRVRSAERPRSIVWNVLACPFLPDWVGTTVVFDLGRDEHGQCALFFRHHGLSPQLDCYDICRRSWDHYLPSLRDYLTTGTGSPLGSEGDTAWRDAGKPLPGEGAYLSEPA